MRSHDENYPSDWPPFDKDRDNPFPAPISQSKNVPYTKDYTIKDSGKRQSFTSGMVRDVVEGKTDYSLVLDGPMFERWAVHLTKGAQKYEARNWLLAGGQPEADRFKQSAFRHFLQWFRGDMDEDHAAAVYFNICGYEYVKDKMKVQGSPLANVAKAQNNPNHDPYSVGI